MVSGRRRVLGRGIRKTSSTNTSSGHSVCGDTDLQYIIWYTVNQPIGDSPEKPIIVRPIDEPQRHAKKTHRSVPKHNIVVPVPENSDMEEDLYRLKQVPSFLPIIRGTVALPVARDREVLERIDTESFYRLYQLYQVYMSLYAKAVTAELFLIDKKILELAMKPYKC